MSNVLKRVFQEKLSFKFHVEVVSALNINQHISDCASILIKKRRKTYQTDMTMLDEHGGMVWNHVFEINMNMYRNKNQTEWEAKKFEIELLSNSSQKMFSQLDFSHFASLKTGESVSVTLPLRPLIASRRGSAQSEIVAALMESSDSSKPNTGKPAIVLRITRGDLHSDEYVSATDSEALLDSSSFTAGSLSRNSRAAKSFTNISSLAEGRMDSLELSGSNGHPSNELLGLFSVPERRKSSENRKEEDKNNERLYKPRVSIVSRALEIDNEEFHRRHASFDCDERPSIFTSKRSSKYSPEIMPADEEEPTH